jgi:hypothetical protein
MMHVHRIDISHELTKMGLYTAPAEVPESDRPAPRYWVAFDSGPFEPIEPRRGSRAITRGQAYERAAEMAESRDADGFQLATRPDEETTWLAEGLPRKRGTTRCDAFVVRWGVAAALPPERIPFRSPARTVWRWLRTHERFGDLHSIDERGGVGALLWRSPTNVAIPVPAELRDAAGDRVEHWAAIVDRMTDKALETARAAEVDADALARAALAEHRKTWIDAPVPPAVAKWSAEGAAAFNEAFERLCRRGAPRRHPATAADALEIVARQVASDIVSGARTL